ncbi:MAG: DUF3617 family protein [Thermoanaerobaculia bacterium]|jgi:hypothetical protein|nr:DUF3617 family protein [Thermoanaerobaculia bacterium]
MSRFALQLTLALSPFAALFPLAAATAAADFPTRKPGIWETTMTMDGGAPVTHRMCFSPAVEKKVLETTAAACSRYEVRRDGPAWIIDSTCKIGAEVTSGRVVTTGDFTGRIHAEVTSESAGKTTAMTLDAKWLRDCAPNEKPGAIVK